MIGRHRRGSTSAPSSRRAQANANSKNGVAIGVGGQVDHLAFGIDRECERGLGFSGDEMLQQRAQPTLDLIASVEPAEQGGMGEHVDLSALHH